MQCPKRYLKPKKAIIKNSVIIQLIFTRES